MHLRKLTLVIGVFGAMSANWTYGLGLGEITLNSSLDEPLKAEIKLLQVRDLAPEEIIVELATGEDFDRAGVDRVYFLQELKFQVELNNPGGPVVKVTSQKPVREPYLNFLVKTQWPSGRLLREYTLLLDIPVFTKESSTPVQPAQIRTPATRAPVTRTEPARPVAEPKPIQPSPAQNAPVSPEPYRAEPRPDPVESSAPQRDEQMASDSGAADTSNQGSDEYGPVQANDTLWEIALKVRPSRSVSVQQTMLALQRLNPDAFINNNINLLKKGQVLRIPTQAEMTSLAQSEAISEVAYQNNQWGGGADQQVGAQLEGARTRPQASTAATEPQGQLTLAAPGDSGNAASSSGAGDTSAQTDALENELAISMEELDSARRETTELNERVSELDEQINTMERLLEVSNAELANLQQAAQQVSAANDAAMDEPAISEPVLSEPGIDLPAIDAPSLEEPEVASEPEPAPKPQVVRPIVPEKTLLDTLMDYLWYIVGGLVLIVAGIFAFMQRRAQRQMEEYDSLDDEEMYTADTGSSEDFGELSDPSFDADEFELADDDAHTEEEVFTPEPTKSETGDAVAEADIYIAYGKFDQAEDMLVRAIEDEPNNAEAKLKLLEVYSETKDINKFDATYGSLLAMGNNSVSQRATDLRSAIPGVGAYVAAAAAADLDFGDTDLSFDEVDTTEPTSSDTSAQSDAESFDFDDLSFDLDEPETKDPVSFESTPSSEPESDTIDFDFDLEDTGDALSLDGVGESLDLDTQSGSTEPAAEVDGLDFNLDFDTETTSSEPPSVDAVEQELTLDLDLDEETPEDDNTRVGGFSFDIEDTTDDELGLSLDDADSEPQPTTEISDDFLSDLEFSTTESTEEGAELADLDLDSDDLDEEQADLDDAFNMDMDDVDLAALDEEMDALVGDLDDIDDEEVRVIPTEVLPELSSEELADLDLDDGFDGESEGDADLDDLISLDDSSLDNLSFEKSIPATGSDEGFGDFGENADGGEDDLENELDFLSDTDEVATKLDLARAYIDMGDKEGAKDILDEVMSEGNDQQKVEAQELIGRM